MGGRRQNSRPAVREAASGEAALDVSNHDLLLRFQFFSSQPPYR